LGRLLDFLLACLLGLVFACLLGFLLGRLFHDASLSLILRLFRGLYLGVALAFVLAVYGRLRKQSFRANLLHRSLLWEWCGACLPPLDALHSATFVPSHPGWPQAFAPDVYRRKRRPELDLFLLALVAARMTLWKMPRLARKAAW